jgi:hypothetical protein
MQTPIRCDDIPVAHTPPGGYRDVMPPPVLLACEDPLAPGAPDLRGTWRVVGVEVEGEVAEKHPALGHVQRIEQCADRIVITGGGVVHDMRCDGTQENRVNDVAESDFQTAITVVATYEAGVHVLRPVGIPITVTRQRDGAAMVWRYLTFTARLERVG